MGSRLRERSGRPHYACTGARDGPPEEGNTPVQERSGTRPGAAPATTDGESGTATDGIESDLRALKVMRDRGLMSQADYDRRRAELLSQRTPGTG